MKYFWPVVVGAFAGFTISIVLGLMVVLNSWVWGLAL